MNENELYSPIINKHIHAGRFNITNPWKSDKQRKYMYWKKDKACKSDPSSKECKKWKRIIKEYED